MAFTGVTEKLKAYYSLITFCGDLNTGKIVLHIISTYDIDEIIRGSQCWCRSVKPLFLRSRDVILWR